MRQMTQQGSSLGDSSSYPVHEIADYQKCRSNTLKNQTNIKTSKQKPLEIKIKREKKHQKKKKKQTQSTDVVCVCRFVNENNAVGNWKKEIEKWTEKASAP